jgi:hypothetical protein
MGDVFWDFVPERDVPRQFRDPYEVAVEEVEKALRDVATDILSADRAVAPLRSEYEALLADLSKKPRDTDIIAALVAKGDWTKQGADTILTLARTYGTAILRNALALADAMGIEDGSSGL